MEIKKQKSLYTIFIRYLIIFCTLTILLLTFNVLIFVMAENANIIKPANYVQNQIEKIKREVDEGMAIDESKLPYPCNYVFYDNQDNILKTNFNKRDFKAVNNYINGENVKSKYIYTTINFDGGKCVVRYDIKAHFTSKELNELIPNLEILYLLVFLITFISICLVIAISFGNKLKKELIPIKISTKKIMEQDLDFVVSQSNIKEFNEVLISISDMKEALKESLQAQWIAKQKKKEQISALAHDIKTPVTVIKGNAELLNEGELSDENKFYTDYIINNANKIEKYVCLLIEMSREDMSLDIKKENIETNMFLGEIENEFKMICLLKNMNLNITIDSIPDNFKGNKELLTRAIINIMSNAVDYSYENGTIEFLVNVDKNNLIFSIKDCGEGFSNEELKNAKNQFYMGKEERTVGKHYGMGLYISETIAKKHNGFLEIKNREDRKGGEVILGININ